MNLGKDRCCIKRDIKVIGSQGMLGKGGDIGDIGYKGYTGHIGYTGPIGICYRGAPGSKGFRGDTGGSTGAQGSTGPQGYPESKQFLNTYFQTSETTATYDNNFTDIITGIDIGNNTITLSPNNQWCIQWSVQQDWIDNNNQFYISLEEFYNPGVYYEPYVFNSLNPYHFKDNIGRTQFDYATLGTGNDYLDLSLISETQFNIKLWQKTLGSSVGIGIINASFTFIKL
jgi:hypothetical protein